LSNTSGVALNALKLMWWHLDTLLKESVDLKKLTTNDKVSLHEEEEPNGR